MIKEIISKQRTFFETGVSKDVSFRIETLKRLKKAIVENEREIMTALRKDLNKVPFESYVTEIGLVIEEIDAAIKHLPRWSKSKRVKSPLKHFPSRSYIYPEPYGIALIIAPWNYPFQLALLPLVGAIAAGNCALIKPSEYSPYTSKVIDRLISKNFNPSFISVVQGDKEVSQALLAEKFDLIFFTGSTKVGKIVMQAAAKHLTPVILELGGKSPCIVDETANIDLAAKRIVWGKFINAGQTCIAPDYLLVDPRIKNQLIAKMDAYIKAFYGATPLTNEAYPKIINEKHFKRLIALINDEKIIAGGGHSLDSLKIEPTIIDEPAWDRPLMEEEIFGPILPILTYKNLNQAIGLINKQPKPLSLYHFTRDKEKADQVIRRTSSGGACINDTIIHVSNPHLPFGGVGASGMGAYHGKTSFDSFSHFKGIMKKSNCLDLPFRYPPYKNVAFIKKVMKHL